jgi:DNA polymerase V
MGDPVFKLQHLVESHGLVVFSSNFELYGDITSRVMSILEDLSPSGFERYSVDESWIGLDGLETAMSFEEFGRMVRERVLSYTGLTVCVGVSSTFTLAKLANRGAKRYKATGGVVDLTDPLRQQKLMKIVEIGDVWGIGRKLSEKLKAMEIHTAWDLAQSDPKAMRDKLSINVERTIRELNGVPCFSIEEVAPTKQQLICSRSFGQKVVRIEDMRQAVAEYVATVARKLRLENRTCRVITVFIRTSPFDSNNPQYSNSATSTFNLPTSDTREILSLARALLDSIWRGGFKYAKAGVMLTDFFEPGVYQQNLFDPVEPQVNNTELMKTIDRINLKGFGKVSFASQGTKKPWAMRREKLSPAYTTRWSDLPVVR